MALFDLSSAAEALEDLLDRERALIKAGRIDQIVRLGAEKERLIGRLARQGASAPGLERLRAKADRNVRLLDAAARGIKAAAGRLDRRGDDGAALRTYGRNGAAAALAGARRGIDRQA
ncbi:MAG: hypothetical protein KDK10_10005 [Maritimibacter sp.]|nr:hypothetical protein [Maritimibacter sp.]